jgi:histone acetyltransferase (RNA polymerase elongator complex component)
VGRAEIVTAPAVRDFQDYAETVKRILTRGDLSPGSLHLVRVQRDIAEAAITFAHNRAQVARLALENVSNVRNIEVKCARARVPVHVFDLGPEPEAA